MVVKVVHGGIRQQGLDGFNVSLDFVAGHVQAPTEPSWSNFGARKVEHTGAVHSDGCHVDMGKAWIKVLNDSVIAGNVASRFKRHQSITICPSS